MTTALNRLDPASRALLDLSLRRGMKVEDIAEVLGVDVDTVVKLREDALTEIAADLGLVDPSELDRARSMLAELPAEHWPRAKLGAANGASPLSVPVGGEGVAQAPAAPGEGEAREEDATGRAGEVEPPGEAEAALPDAGEAAEAPAAGAPEAPRDSAAEPPAAGAAEAPAEPPAAGAAEAPGEAQAAGAAEAPGDPAAEPPAAHEAGEGDGEAPGASVVGTSADGAAEPSVAGTSAEGDAEPPADGVANASNEGERGREARTGASASDSRVGAVRQGTIMTTGRRRRSPLRWLLALLGLVAIAAAIVLPLTLGGGAQRAAKRPPAPRRPAVATRPATPKSPPPPATRARPPAPAPRAARPVTARPIAGAPAGASATLTPLPGGELKLSVTGLLRVSTGYYAVWLYNSIVDSTPLGHFTATPASATFRLPPSARHFRFLDVSRQPDGTTAVHSGESVLRVDITRLRQAR